MLNRHGPRILVGLALSLMLGFSTAMAAAPDHLHVPDGFTIEVAAAPPLVGFPMMGGFDDRGRLYLAESAGKNLDAQQLAAELPNFVRRLEDTDGDGVFDRSTVFADKMTYPMGALWHDGSLYVASPPYIWKLTDADDDGVAERREELVGKFGYIGNAADIHGCFLGPEGRIYWCDGRHGHEFVDEQGQVHSAGKAARIFSCTTQGRDIQAHCGGGMDNPVEIDFTPGGDMLGTVNLMYQKRGDCLVHWMHGGVYPRDDQPQHLAEFKRTGDLMPEVFNFGHVAVSGMLRYGHTHLGEEFLGRVMVTEFNTHKLCSLKLTPEGSTWRAEKEEFLASTNNDFHPTDVIEDADGSLLVVDTGGWFRNGCPASQVAKPEILGGLYRIRRSGGKRPTDPRGEQLSWDNAAPDELIARLDDARRWVIRRTMSRLARHGGNAVAALDSVLRPDGGASVITRINAVWTLARIDDWAARAVNALALRDGEATVRQAAAHCAGVWRDKATAARLAEMTVHDEPAVRRAAATALGKIGASPAVASLLAALEQPVDRLLEHALIYALIEINDPSATVAGLSSDKSHVRRATLIALDQMQAPQLTREQTARLLDTDDAALQRTAVEVISKRPGWADELLGRLDDWLLDEPLDEARQSVVRGALLAFGREEGVQRLIGRRLGDAATPLAAKRLLLEVVARSELAQRPDEWKDPLLAALGHGDIDVRRQAVAAVSHSDAAAFAPQLANLADDEALPESLRFEAAAALGKASQPLGEAAWELLAARVAGEAAPLERLSAAEALGAAALSDLQRHALLKTVVTAGPLELASLLHAYDRGGEAALGRELVAALRSAPGVANLPVVRLEKLISQFGPEASQMAHAWLQSLGSNTAGSAAAIEALVTAAAQADLARGQELFFGHRAACSACHRVAGKGDQVGPDLSKIGDIRTVRDLAESVVLPSQSIARGYESYQVSLHSGLSQLGVIRRESPDMIWLRTADRAEVAISRSQIEEMAASPVSIMPQGLDQVLGVSDLAAIVAYLASLK